MQDDYIDDAVQCVGVWSNFLTSDLILRTVSHLTAFKHVHTSLWKPPLKTSHSATSLNPSLESDSHAWKTWRKVQYKWRGGLRVLSQDSAGEVERVRCAALIWCSVTQQRGFMGPYSGITSWQGARWKCNWLWKSCSCMTDEVEHGVLSIVRKKAARNVFFQPRGILGNTSEKMQSMNAHTPLLWTPPAFLTKHCLSC